MEEEDGRERYITSKLVQLEDDQIASRVINRSAVLPCESQTDITVISSLSSTLCSVTGRNAADIRGDAFEATATEPPLKQTRAPPIRGVLTAISSPRAVG